MTIKVGDYVYMPAVSNSPMLVEYSDYYESLMVKHTESKCIYFFGDTGMSEDVMSKLYPSNPIAFLVSEYNKLKTVYPNLIKK